MFSSSWLSVDVDGIESLAFELFAHILLESCGGKRLVYGRVPEVVVRLNMNAGANTRSEL